MPETTTVGKAVRVAFERNRHINLNCYPIRFEFDITKAALILEEGEVENIVDKKRAFEIASQTEDI